MYCIRLKPKASFNVIVICISREQNEACRQHQNKEKRLPTDIRPSSTIYIVNFQRLYKR